MRLFNFIEKVATAGIKTVMSPVAAVADIIDGTPFEKTGNLLESAVEDIEGAFEDED